jgi:hypothetical protein
VEAVREADLKQLVRAVREFFKSFETANFKDLSMAQIQRMIEAHKLSVSDLLTRYSRKLRNIK